MPPAKKKVKRTVKTIRTEHEDLEMPDKTMLLCMMAALRDIEWGSLFFRRAAKIEQEFKDVFPDHEPRSETRYQHVFRPFANYMDTYMHVMVNDACNEIWAERESRKGRRKNPEPNKVKKKKTAAPTHKAAISDVEEEEDALAVPGDQINQDNEDEADL